MQHAKFRGNRPAGSSEEDFLKNFTIYGRGGHNVPLTIIISTNFHFHDLKAYIQNLVKTAQ